MHFHAPREILEHPTVLVDALCSGDIPVSLDDTGFRAHGEVGEADVELLIQMKRFRGNLYVGVTPSKYLDRMATVVSALKAVNCELPMEEQEEWIREVLDQDKRVRDRASSLERDIATILSQLDVSPVHKPLTEEFEFVYSQFGRTTDIERMIREIREEEQMVGSSVEAQEFEDAARHRDKRERLLDDLYDLCKR